MFRTHLNLFASIAAGALIVAGCSSVETNSSLTPGSDLSGFTTYSWKPLVVTNPATRVDPNSPLHAEFVRLIDSEMKRVDLRREPAGEGQLHVSYSVLRQEVIGTSMADASSGYGSRSIEGRGYAVSSSFGGGPRTTVNEQGRVLIDIEDAKTGKLLWRGSASAQIQPHSGPVRDAALISRVVIGIFRDFPR